jgi:hypothetical protein
MRVTAFVNKATAPDCGLRGQSIPLTCINGDRTAVRSLRSSALFLAAPQRRGVSGTLARSPMRFAAAALSLSPWRRV